MNNNYTYNPGSGDDATYNQKPEWLDPNADNSGFVGISVPPTIGGVDIFAGLQYDDEIINPSFQEFSSEIPQQYNAVTQVVPIVSSPIMTILDKAKKKTEKLVCNFSLKLPSVEVYNMLTDNFDDSEDVFIDYIIKQIQDGFLRSSIKDAIKDLYKKKNLDGK